MPNVHPTAVVEPGAQLADDVTVGPMCYVGEKVTLGKATRLVSHVSILARTTLGSHNTVWPGAVLGADPQDLKFKGEDSLLTIGDHNELRENVTIHIGTDNGGGSTQLGNHNMVMVGAHIAHDCIIHDHVLIANNCGLSGHVEVKSHANIAGLVGVHHFVTFGEHSFIGGMSRVVHDVPPYMIAEGDPAKVRGVNSIGLERHKFTPDAIAALKDACRLLFPRSQDSAAVANKVTDENIKALEEKYPDQPQIKHLLAALENARASALGRFRETQRHDNRRTGQPK